MIDVGINENVILTDIKLNDKDILEISFDTLEAVSNKVDVFDDLLTAKVENEGRSYRTLNIFSFKKPSGPKNEDKTADELIEMVSEDMKTRRTQLSQLMELYVTSDEINAVWNPYAGTTLDRTNYREKFLDNDTLVRIFRNYAHQAISVLTPFLKNASYPLRLKLLRQSKEKHFPEIPKRYLADWPFVELMEVPVAKVKMSPYEIKEGLDNAIPLARPAGDGSAMPDATPPEGKNVFGQR